MAWFLLSLRRVQKSFRNGHSLVMHTNISLVIKRLFTALICPFLVAATKHGSPAATETSMIRRQVKDIERQISDRVRDPALGRRARFYALDTSNNKKQIVGVIYITDGSEPEKKLMYGSAMNPGSWPAGVYIFKLSRMHFPQYPVVIKSCYYFTVRYDIKTKEIVDFPLNC